MQIKPILTHVAAAGAGLLAGVFIAKQAITKSLNSMMGGANPQMMQALSQNMPGSTPNAGQVNPLANIDPKMMEQINQQLAQLSPQDLQTLNKELANMDPAQLNALAAQMGLPPMPAGTNLNLMSSPNAEMPILNAPKTPIVMPSVKRTPIMPLNITANQLNSGALKV